MNKISQTIPYQFDTIFSPFKAGEFEDALTFLRDVGFTGVEVAVADPRPVDAGELARQVSRRGLSITSISTGQAYDKYGISLSSSDEEKRGEAVEFVKGHVDISEATGSPVVTVGLLRGKIEKDNKASLTQNLRMSMLRCVEYAASHGVNLQLEPINRSETVLINNVAEALGFLEELGNPENLGILYDTYHSNLEDGDMISAVKAASGRIMNVHLADSHRGLPGYGSIDFASIYEAIQGTGYKGAYALETLSIPSSEFVKEHCFESVSAFIKA
ncbi:MAG: sugar phosphate isomerase/epimerase [Synergistaceae bacterium]|jgi:sugar phosphate isomerase/epimerase|nr:sugar phosphate isomerase/epimerase [Synergistaceae bacterium]